MQTPTLIVSHCILALCAGPTTDVTIVRSAPLQLYGLEIGNICQVALAIGAILAAVFTWRNYRLNVLIKERDAYVELNKMAMDEQISEFLEQDPITLFCHAFMSHNWMVYQSSRLRLVGRELWDNERRLLHKLARKREFEVAFGRLVAGYPSGYNRVLIEAIEAGRKWRADQTNDRGKKSAGTA